MSEAITVDTDAAADGIALRPMTPEDLDQAYSLSMDLHWPHRPEDWATAYGLGQGLVAERDGEVVGTGLRWLWGEDHATVGLVIVAPQCRGRRVGNRLMSALLDKLDTRNVLLHATTEGRGLYERLGFTRIGEVRQHQGIAKPAPLVALGRGWRLRPANQNDLPTLLQLDTQARGMHRPALLEELLHNAGTAVMLDYEDEPRGFAFMRRFGRGWIIGPVIAPDDTGAKALIAHLAGLNAGKFTRIDIDFDSGLAEWVESLGLLRVGAVTTMVRGEKPATDPSVRLYAIATQALA